MFSFFNIAIVFEIAEYVSRFFEKRVWHSTDKCMCRIFRSSKDEIVFIKVVGINMGAW